MNKYLAILTAMPQNAPKNSELREKNTCSNYKVGSTLLQCFSTAVFTEI